MNMGFHNLYPPAKVSAGHWSLDVPLLVSVHLIRGM